MYGVCALCFGIWLVCSTAVDGVISKERVRRIRYYFAKVMLCRFEGTILSYRVKSKARGWRGHDELAVVFVHVATSIYGIYSGVPTRWRSCLSP